MNVRTHSAVSPRYGTASLVAEASVPPIAAPPRYVAPTAAATQPSSESRSGASTERFPNRSAGRSVSHTPIRILRTVRARNSIRSGCGSPGAAAGVVEAAAASTSAAAPTVPKAGAVPVYDATAPRTGPNIAPAIATPNAAPISCPRLPGEEAATSQASPPVHVNALDAP